MSTILRRKRTSRLSLGPYRRHELLGGWATYPVQGYDGYGDGHEPDMRKFICDAMRRDWAASRELLVTYWESQKSDCEFFPHDCLPWLYVYRQQGALPWACAHLD